MDAIDYAEAAGDAFLWGVLVACGFGAVLALRWWWGQADRLMTDLEGVKLWR